MNKKFLILLILLFTSGCWNYNELNTLAITTAIAIDLTEDNKYEVSLLIASSKKGQTNSEDAQSSTIVYSGKGKSISEAMKEINSVISRQIYIGHISVVIISEDIAKKGMLDTLDFLLKYSESTRRFQLAIAKDTKAKNIIKIVTPLETFPAQNVSENIKISSETQAKSSSLLFSQFIYTLLEKGINPIVPTITVKGDIKDGSKDESLQQTTPEAKVKLESIALFQDDKLKSHTSTDESKGINIIRNQINQMYLYLKCDNKSSTINITRLNTDIKVKDAEKLKFVVKIDSDGTLIENNCNFDLMSNKAINKLEKKAEKELKSLVDKGFKKARKSKLDVFGFGNKLYKENPKIFNKYKNWDKDVFNDIDVDFDINVELKYKGATKKNIKEILHEN